MTQTVRPPPLTSAQRQAVQECLVKAGVTIGGGAATSTVTPGQGAPPPPAPGGFGGPVGKAALSGCLPQGQSFSVGFTTPQQEIQQVVNPPATNINNASYTAAGIDPATPRQGLVIRPARLRALGRRRRPQ